MSKLFFHLLIVLAVLIAGPLRGQTAANPFDLRPRMVEELPAEEKGPALPSEPLNPFDIRRPGTEQLAPDVPVIPLEAPDNQDSAYRRFLFSLIMLDLLGLTILITLFRSVVARSYRAFLNDNMLNQVHRDEGAFASLPFQLLYLFFFLNAGLLTYLIVRYLGGLPGPNYWRDFLWVTGALGGVFLLKHLLLKIVQWVFDLGKEIRLYSFTIIVFSIILGLVILPFNLLIAYGPEDMLEGSIYVVLGLIVLAYLFRTFRGLFIAGSYLAFHKFHFLLYICTIEIAPVILLIKLVSLVSIGRWIG